MEARTGVPAVCLSLLALVAAVMPAAALAGAGAHAGYGDPVASDELAHLRAGEIMVPGSHNLTNVAQSDQNTVGTIEGGIDADAVSSGRLSISDQALQNARGINNVVANSAPQSVVQGTVQLTVILNN